MERFLLRSLGGILDLLLGTSPFAQIVSASPIYLLTFKFSILNMPPSPQIQYRTGLFLLLITLVLEVSWISESKRPENHIYA